MAGIALVLDLIKRNPNSYYSSSGSSLYSFGSFSAKAALSGTAAASVAASYPFAFRTFLAGKDRIAHCDASATWSDDQFPKDQEAHLSGAVDDYISKDSAKPGYIFEPDFVSDAVKAYHIELKPLLSAFHWRTFMFTTLRSFLLYYLPLLEPSAVVEDDDEDFLPEGTEEHKLDLVTPFEKSVKQIIRESTVVTTRRVLERLTVSYFSQRMAWKLLKDAPKSAIRKSLRGMPTTVYIYAVTKTTFRAHLLGVAASFIVQVGVDLYKTISRFFNTGEELDEVDKREELRLLGRKVVGVTVRCTASLIFAAIGAGLGSTFIRPSLGQWMGCAAGDLAGPVIVALCFDKLLRAEV